MSRTRRRRAATFGLYWVLRDYRWVNGSLQPIQVDPHSAKGRKDLARYHSDAGFGDYSHASAPRWYRRSLNHRDDRREEQELHRWRRNPQHEVVLPRRGRDASWYW